jgi:hypothetical protein
MVVSSSEDLPDKNSYTPFLALWLERINAFSAHGQAQLPGGLQRLDVLTLSYTSRKSNPKESMRCMNQFAFSE